MMIKSGGGFKVGGAPLMTSSHSTKRDKHI